MPATRNQIMEALLALLSPGFTTASRRNRAPDTIAIEDTPALMLVEHSENHVRAAPQAPAKRTLEVRAIVYNDVGDDADAIPSADINDRLDAIEAALVASPATGKCTLGGLVESVVIEGEIVKAPGDISGKGLAVVPILIVIP